MAMMMIICPLTGRSVSTGLETDGESFTQIPHAPLLVDCSACGGAHEWALLNAWLTDNPPPPAAANSN